MVQSEIRNPVRRRRTTQTQNEHRRKKICREDGFSIVGLLGLLPFFIAIFTGSGALGLLLRERTEKQSFCESFIFKMQDQLADEMNRLTKLNPQAQALRAAYKRAQARFYAAAASGNQVAVLAAEKKLAEIEMKRAQLDLEQKALLTKTEQISQGAKIKIKLHIKDGRIQLAPKGLMVEPDTPLDIAPLYRPMLRFREVQLGQIQYRWHDAQGSCAASIEQRGPLFRATLAEVRQ